MNKTYLRIFDEANPNCRKELDYNKLFLETQEKYFNHLLKVKGHVFLNEVFDALGFGRIRDGQIMGWHIASDEGNNYVNFHITETNGYFELDFNVADILDKIPL